MARYPTVIQKRPVYCTGCQRGGGYEIEGGSIVLVREDEMPNPTHFYHSTTCSNFPLGLNAPKRKWVRLEVTN